MGNRLTEIHDSRQTFNCRKGMGNLGGYALGAVMGTGGSDRAMPGFQPLTGGGDGYLGLSPQAEMRRTVGA
jgi:hypothetical protein